MGFERTEGCPVVFPLLTESCHHSHVGALQVHPASGVFKVPSRILHTLNDHFQRLTCFNHTEALTPLANDPFTVLSTSSQDRYLGLSLTTLRGIGGPTVLPVMRSQTPDTGECMRQLVEKAFTVIWQHWPLIPVWSVMQCDHKASWWGTSPRSKGWDGSQI